MTLKMAKSILWKESVTPMELITFISLQAVVQTQAEGEVEGCGICGGGGAAVLKRSSCVFLMITALAAFLLVA